MVNTTTTDRKKCLLETHATMFCAKKRMSSAMVKHFPSPLVEMLEASQTFSRSLCIFVSVFSWAPRQIFRSKYVRNLCCDGVLVSCINRRHE